MQIDTTMVHASPTTVLVVDDEWLIRTDLAQNLERAGYCVREASNAAEAIAMLERDSSIRVVFTDIQMPGMMDGIALSHHIRQRWPPTILVVSSGNRAPLSSELPDNTEFLAKPVGRSSLDKLLQNIERKLTTAQNTASQLG